MDHPRPCSQRGFSLLEAALVVLLVGSAIAVGFLLLRAHKPVRQVQAQEQALQWADQAILAYAARNAHLPCAVAKPGSDADDCVAPGQKGWLPVRTLQGVHPGGAGAMPPLRYMVYRGDGGSTDLTLAQQRFSPHKWDGTPHEFDAVNGLDLCAALAGAAQKLATSGDLRSDRARTTDIDGNAINVAYGLGVAGVTPGADGLFDGQNQQAGARMESPSRGADAGYDDRVRVRSFNSLARTLGCEYADARDPDGLVLASLDMLALAVDVSDEVDAQNAGLIEETQSAVVMAGVAEAFGVLNVALAAAGLASSASTLVTGSAQLYSAIQSCPLPPFVTCGLIPPYTKAVALGTLSTALATNATELAAAALVATSTGLALTVQARDMANEAEGTPPVDLEGLAEKACVTAEGGTLYEKADENGNLTPVPAGYWKDGLKQEVDQLEDELEQTIADRNAAEERLTWLGEIPSHLIDYPPKPKRKRWKRCVEDEDGNVSCHWEHESDASYNQRIEGWLKTRQEMEEVLQPKLAAVRAAEDAYFHWETTVEFVNQAQVEYDQMLDAVDQLRQEVQQCDASPPSDLVDVHRCSNSRVALLGMTTCDLDVLTADQVERRQCLTWKQEDLTEAEADEDQAWENYVNKLRTATSLPAPPVTDYLNDPGIPGSNWLCTMRRSCDPLIVPGQHDDEDDKRETYAMTYYKLLGLRKGVEEQTAELEAKREAYEHAQAQCDTLRALKDGGAGGGSKTPIIVGAENILRSADCNGATGPVHPDVCPTGAVP